jgi:FAD:protein FMN transferase
MHSNSRRQFLVTAGLAGGVALGLTRPFTSVKLPGAGELRSAQRKSRAFGTEISIVALHGDSGVAARAIGAAFDEIERVEQVMSLYRPDSQLCQLNRDGFLQRPHPYLVAVLEKAQSVARESEGAFDVTVQPLWELYAAAMKRNTIPDAAAIAQARSKVDWRRLEVSAQRIVLREKGMAVTLNGIAQGFGTDRATAALRAHGVRHSLLNTGEISTVGRKEHEQPWKIGIQHPRESEAYISLAALDGRCMATSGDYATSFSADCAYNHIFDPHTGRSPDHFSSVTIVANSAMEADALTKPVFVGGLERGLELIAAHGAEAYIVRKDGECIATRGFPLAS